MTWTILPARHLGLDRVQEAHELLMAVALHVAADDGPVEDVERSGLRVRLRRFSAVRKGDSSRS
jgi:hypothetical protein